MFRKYEKTFIPNPDFKHNYKEFTCVHCSHKLCVPVLCDEVEVFKKHEDYINSLHKHFDNLVNELQAFFPDTPIQDYFIMRREEMVESIQLVVKKMNGDFSEIDEIKLNQNSWFNSMNKKVD